MKQKNDYELIEAHVYVSYYAPTKYSSCLLSAIFYQAYFPLPQRCILL